NEPGRAGRGQGFPTGVADAAAAWRARAPGGLVRSRRHGRHTGVVHGDAVCACVDEPWRRSRDPAWPVRSSRRGRMRAHRRRCGGDRSDGLVAEAERKGAASGCGVALWLEAVPVDEARAGVFGDAWQELALGGGEDFELLFALEPEALATLRSRWAGRAPLTV